MTPETIEDLKQFIQAAFVQHGFEIDTRLDRIDARLDGIDVRMNGFDEQFTELRLTLNATMQAVGETFADHERRITRLEARPA